eukprot:TRINITY_DN31189_c0_g1_i1.p1 TRINITY_DN31189_c0_g1~~TRINITY_DN31189_c0_g1_i1.p1  ORF type:complete len:256 (+),score=48.97 TRINITY_DN31189_c0_g1_i1:80-847(+)
MGTAHAGGGKAQLLELGAHGCRAHAAAFSLDSSNHAVLAAAAAPPPPRAARAPASAFLATRGRSLRCREAAPAALAETSAAVFPLQRRRPRGRVRGRLQVVASFLEPVDHTPSSVSEVLGKGPDEPCDCKPTCMAKPGEVCVPCGSIPRPPKPEPPLPDTQTEPTRAGYGRKTVAEAAAAGELDDDPDDPPYKTVVTRKADLPPCDGGNVRSRTQGCQGDADTPYPDDDAVNYKKAAERMQAMLTMPARPQLPGY